MDKRLECLSELEQFKKIKRAAEEKKTCAVFGVDEQKPYFTALLSELTGRKLFIVVPNEADVVKTQAVMNRLAGKSLSFPTKDYNFRTVESVSRFDENRRIETVAAIRKKDFSSVVIPAEALCTLVMPPEDYREDRPTHLNSTKWLKRSYRSGTSGSTMSRDRDSSASEAVSSIFFPRRSLSLTE